MKTIKRCVGLALFAGLVFFSAQTASAKSKWGKSYVRSSEYFLNIDTPLFIGGKVYFTAQKKAQKVYYPYYVKRLDGNTTIASDQSSFSIYDINDKLLYEDSNNNLFYDGNLYAPASGPEEINNALIYRQSGGDSFDYEDFDLHLGSANITHSQLATYCDDENDVSYLSSTGQILGYDNKFYVNCPNGEKTLIFNSSGTKVDEQNNGGIGLAATAGCNGDEVVAATEPARTNYQTTASAFYKYGGKLILNPKCSDGNLYYYSYEVEPYGLYKNGASVAEGAYEFALINGKAYWINDGGRIQCEDGAVFPKLKGGYRIFSVFNNNGKIGLVAYKSNKNWKKAKYFILTKK